MKIGRRALLRGTGACVALPFFESVARAQEKPPVRLFLYVVGGGVYLPMWTIDDAGRREPLSPAKSVEFLGAARACDEPLDVLSPSLAPLDSRKKDLLVLGGLTLSDAFGFEDGHSAEIGALLTSTLYARDRVACGMSMDQVAARHFEGKTRVDALTLGLHGSRPGGAKGIGRVYAQHYSWRTSTTPTGEERNPRLVFDRLFRTTATAPDDAERKSVLDAVREDAKSLRSSLGGLDRAKLDEYLAAVRDVEKRIAFAKKPDPAGPASDSGDVERRLPAEKGIPEDYTAYDRLMVDLVALAFRADLTRVAVLTHGGYRAYPEMGVKRGHHDVQHHEGVPEKREDLAKIDLFNTTRFADVVKTFAEAKLLDASMLVFGSGMSNPNRHSRENLPILLAGRAGGTLRPGRHVDYDWKKKTPVANLWVELLKRLDVPVQRFGDSTGGLANL
jgi:hypothetical protein